jgi:hypothetical protein
VIEEEFAKFGATGKGFIHGGKFEGISMRTADREEKVEIRSGKRGKGRRKMER